MSMVIFVYLVSGLVLGIYQKPNPQAFARVHICLPLFKFQSYYIPNKSRLDHLPIDLNLMRLIATSAQVHRLGTQRILITPQRIILTPKVVMVIGGLLPALSATQRRLLGIQLMLHSVHIDQTLAGQLAHLGR